jgi:thiol:disulfide interchange protein/DsbC/DsbD-like thiol-disulfide interchange protein
MTRRGLTLGVCVAIAWAMSMAGGVDFAAEARGQGGFGGGAKGKSAPKQRVAFTAVFEPATAGPGQKVQLKITAQPLADHYMYSLTQGDGGKPTQITLSDFAGLVPVETPKFSPSPKPKIEKSEGFDGEVIQLEKHAGQVVFATTLVVAKSAKPGSQASVKVQIDYGVCDKRQCYFPPKAELAATLRVGQAVAGADAAAPALASMADEPAAAPATEAAPAAEVPAEDAPPPPEVVGDVAPVSAPVEEAAAPNAAAPGGAFEHVVKKAGQSTVQATWTVTASPRVVTPNGEVTVTITAKLNPGWHIYSQDQTRLGEGDEAEGPLRTGLAVLDAGALVAKTPRFQGPVPTDKPSEGWPGLTERHHEGTVVWTQAFSVPAGVSGKVPLAGKVAYMMCDHTGCLNPIGFAFAGEVEVGDAAVAEPAILGMTEKLNAGEADEFVSSLPAVGASQPVVAVVPEGVPAAAAAAAPGAANGPGVQAAPSTGTINKSSGLGPFLLAAFAAGFLALLTPCVFPMVPITVTFFLKQAEQEHHKPLPLAMVYCLGIMATFTGLGLIMSVVFGATKLNEIANDPWLNLVIGGVLVFFAMNLLGLFEIRMPGWLLTYTAGQEGRGGYLGVLFMALTFTLTSFTCTFAFAGGLLVAAANGDRLWPILGLLAFSFSFSLPFFFLALFPSLLKKMPKSGGWMNLVKVTMGLVELGAAFKFFSVADLSWNPTPLIFDQELVLSAWMVIAISTGLYLLGLFHTAHDTPTESIGVLRMFSAMSFFGLAAYLAVGLLSAEKPGGQLWQNIYAFLPPKFERTDAPSKLGPVLTHDGLEYALDVREALKVAIAENKPLFIDITGINCVNCRLMEKGTMADPQIRERLRRFVRVQLFVDRVPSIQDRALASELREINTDLQEKWFGDATMPAYAIVPPRADALQNPQFILSRALGLTEVNEFAKFLDTGFAESTRVQAQAGLVGKSH